ncbi:MAG: B12-binding domain-containing radical SAM protein [Deltaproteobacteria bacterium]|nr:B12-binding domain-containing radical SAM protein [Deltaproteobacteria bacterium]
MQSQRICLVGPSLQGNLALEYLAASTIAGGHRVQLVSFDSIEDIQDCVREILSFNPDVVGLSITFQCLINDHLELVRILRKNGYSGHVTCGGHVPTFCFSELLKEAPGIDTVVRHEGEQTLVKLLDTMGRGEKPSEINGLVWREENEIKAGPTRRLLSNLEALPWPLRRQEPFVAGGAPIAVMLTSRGCIGECNYCCLRAFGKDAGGKRFRMRDAEDIADEIASAYHEIGVRVVILQDDLFILPSEQKSIERITSISRAMKSRGVDKMLFWIKGRPETITDSVAEAAGEMGAIHMFLGVENASLERLRYLGRTHTHHDAKRAISRCLDHKIRSSFNIMLFDPDCSLRDIITNIDFAEQYLNLTWNICRTEVYPGTPLLDRLRNEGRLEGDWRAYGYQIRDQRAEMMFRVLRVCFDRRAFISESLLNRLINLSFGRHVHEELLPGPATEAMSNKVDRLIADVYQDTVDELRRVADFVSRANLEDIDKSRDFAIETAMGINERDHLWNRQLDDIAFLLDARGTKIRQDSRG